MPDVVMVKKRLANGEPCAKCVQAEEMLKKRGVWEQIREVVWADESDPQSPGMQLAAKYEVALAPFFLVSDGSSEPEVLTSTMKVVRLLAPRSPNPELRPAAPKGPLTPTEVAEASQCLADASPQEVIRWALSRFGNQCAIAFSGAEDVAVIDMAHRTGLPFRVFCLDTGRLHPETYQFIETVRKHYDVPIELTAPQAEPLQSLVRAKGLFSFYEDGHGECCSIRKVEPLRRILGSAQAWMTGQRRDQSPSTRGDVSVVEDDAVFQGVDGNALSKFNPLAHWSSAQVWQYIRDQGVPYNPLHDGGYISIGCQPCTRPARPGEHERAARWWWEETTKRECGLHIAAEPTP